MYAAGAPVTALGGVGSWTAPQKATRSNNCSFGDLAIGPNGQVLLTCQHPTGSQGPATLYDWLDVDGLGSGGFGHRVFIASTNVGGFDYIPAQQERSVDAETGLAYDRSGGPNEGRVYLVYTVESPDESNNMDIVVRYSANDGRSWSSRIRANDDLTSNSQFNPKLSLDQTTGNIALCWHDARLDHGSGGLGDTDGLPNDDAQFYCTFSTNAGQSLAPNIRVSEGTSNATASHNGIDYGDYTGLSFYGGVAHPAWADNSNSTGNNPDGTLHQLDIYTATVPVQLSS
jgi:hypothetical protein